MLPQLLQSLHTKSTLFPSASLHLNLLVSQRTWCFPKHMFVGVLWPGTVCQQVKEIYKRERSNAFICHSLDYTVMSHVLFQMRRGDWQWQRAWSLRLHCFSAAAPDSISRGKANGSRAQMTRQHSCPETAGTNLPHTRPGKGSCYEW